MTLIQSIPALKNFLVNNQNTATSKTQRFERENDFMDFLNATQGEVQVLIPETDRHITFKLGEFRSILKAIMTQQGLR